MSYQENEALLQWLAKEMPEAVLEPELEIVDPHHHLWDWRRTHVAGANAGLALDFDPNVFEQKVYYAEHIAAEIASSGHNVVQTVFVECGAMYKQSGPVPLRCVGETEFVLGQQAICNSGAFGSNTQLAAGISGSAAGMDGLQLGGATVGAVLDAQLAAAPRGEFKGIRCGFPDDLNKTWQEGFAELGARGLSWEHCVGPGHIRLPLIAQLAQAHPDTTIIINHMGTRCDPSAGAAEFEEWKQCLATVAACPNVFMKLGGAQQRMGDWLPPFHMHNRQEAGPISSAELCAILFKWYSHIIDTFGPARCMFESNYPVDKECVSYRTLWNMFKRVCEQKGLTASQKADLFAGTARRAYKLPPAPDAAACGDDGTGEP